MHYTPFLAIAICLSALWIAALAPAKMHSVKIAGGLCQTTGGSKIVGIPGFPGEKIDRRIKPDLKKLISKYKLFVVDGYSNDPVHASNGEHPMGLAADLVPDTAHGGNWNLIDKLAKKAEPRQNMPRAPYRWVGYDGDAGHGRGNHLHLSWSHSELSGKRRFPKSVITKHCPHRGGGTGGGTPPAEATTPAEAATTVAATAAARAAASAPVESRTPAAARAAAQAAARAATRAEARAASARSAPP